MTKKEDLEHELNGVWYDAGGFSKEAILDLMVAAYNKAIEDVKTSLNERDQLKFATIEHPSVVRNRALDKLKIQ